MLPVRPFPRKVRRSRLQVTGNILRLSGLPTLREVWINGVLTILQATNGNGSVGLFNGQSAVNAMTIGALYQHDAAQFTYYSTSPQIPLPATIDEIVVLNHQPLSEEIQAAYTRCTLATGMFQDGRWTKQGTLVTAPAWPGAFTPSVIEPSVLYLSSSSQVMACSSRNIVGSNETGQMTASTPLGTWSDPGSNPVTVAEAHGNHLLVTGGTYYWFYTDGTTVYYKTSSTAAAGSWSTATSTGVTTSTLSVSSLWGINVFLDPNDGTWKMFAEGYNGSRYYLYLLTSSSATIPGATWTAYTGNPLSSLLPAAAGEASHANCHPNIMGTGIYSLWYHGSIAGVIPTFMMYSTSTDLHNWTTPLILLRLNAENFSGTGADQIADPSVVQCGSETIIFYDTDFELIDGGRIEAASYSGTLANLLVDPPSVAFGSTGAHFRRKHIPGRCPLMGA